MEKRTQSRDVSPMGQFGFNGSNDGITMGICIVFQHTPIAYVIIWDVLLGLHIISLLVPKRYAITSTHLFADGQRYEWSRLVLPKRQPKHRIMLLRKGWGPFGPLPLGGDRSDLDIAAERIIEILHSDQEE